jgi:hypothetical protein
MASGWKRLQVSRPLFDYHSAFSMVAITPDVRLAATASYGNQIEIWNGFTGESLQRFDAPNDVTKLAFSEDGSKLASGHLDGSIFLWDTGAAWKAAVPERRLSQAELQQSWEELREDGQKPALALHRLFGDPSGTVELLNRELRPARPSVARRAGGLIRLLLLRVGDGIRGLRAFVLAKVYDGRVRMAAHELLADIGRLVEVDSGPAAPSLRRRLLAVGLAERIGTANARRVLEKVAAGAPEARETRAASDAIRRLDNRP